MKLLIEILKNTKPQHDYPAGLIHPYWARKPINITEKIINRYSNPGDTLLDPFMGSGTTLFAGLMNNRNVIGSDINPISNLLVEVILSTGENTKELKAFISGVIDDWSNQALELYKTIDGYCVEREFFDVIGEYANSNFSLTITEAKLRPIINKNIKGKIRFSTKFEYFYSESMLNFNKPLDFDSINFIENTRIAVHKGVKASDFFTIRNQAFINYCLDYIEQKNLSLTNKNFLNLFLSSMLPLLRLSDKKASSQWPYWRPKQKLTSRNPIVALRKRKKAFDALLDWSQTNLSNKSNFSKTFNMPAQKIDEVISESIDLIITDPPYADHAPYLEYSDFYWSIIDKKVCHDLWNYEIVKTNAVGREVDSNSYQNRIEESFKSMLRKLKPNGYLVFFYVDKNLNHWDSIKKSLLESNCSIEEVVAIEKQRRSMKTVTSPGKTLDGDLIVVCKKNNNKLDPQEKITISDALKKINEITYFKKFAKLLNIYLTMEIIDLDKTRKNDISRVL